MSRAIAFAVGKMAQQQGVAVKTSAEALQQAIDDNFWKPGTATTVGLPFNTYPAVNAAGYHVLS